MKKKSTVFDTKEFNNLNAVWSKKLKESGFEDIENPKNKDWCFTKRLCNCPIHNKLANKEFTEKYYQDAGYYFHHGKFTSEIQKKVWELHADGDTIQEIATKLGKGRTTIHFHIHKVLVMLKNGETDNG